MLIPVPLLNYQNVFKKILWRQKAAKATTATATIINNDNNAATAMITAASEVIIIFQLKVQKNNAGVNLKDKKTFNQNQRKMRMTQIQNLWMCHSR